MNDNSRQRSALRWRGIFILAALLLTLTGSWAPPVALQAATSPTQTNLFVDRLADYVPHAAGSLRDSPNALSVSPGVVRQRVATQTSTTTDAPLPAPAGVSEGRIRYFSQTVHFLRGAFLNFWETHGATPVLGQPITEPMVEDGLTVQYLERARLEWHPENAEPKNQVQLTRLGAVLVANRGLTFGTATPAQPSPTTYYFTETGHNLSNAFLQYWQNNGGLAVFGYPLSEEIVETNPADGKQYTVQYFERNRFEWHPENPPAYNVQLGLLGVEYAQQVSLNPLARVLVPEPVGNGQDLSDSPQLASLVNPDLLPAVQELSHAPQFRWVAAVIIQNNIPIDFTNIGEEGVAGAFITTRSRSRPYAIVIPTTEQGESTLALASVIAHEATHAYDVTAGVASSRLRCSVEEELRAYMNGFAAWMVLQGPDALSQSYTPNSLDSAVNRSLRNFNGGSDTLSLDFDAQSARDFLRTLYGSSCGQ